MSPIQRIGPFIIAPRRKRTQTVENTIMMMMMIRTTTYIRLLPSWYILLLIILIAASATTASAADDDGSASSRTPTTTGTGTGTGTSSSSDYAGAVTQLTVDTFETLTEGKSVFIKFFAPWCGHCRSMSNDWIKLANEWNNHPIGLIAEVDCTSDGGQPICEDFDVQSFPTLVYGDPMSAETYDGERDYESMSEFAKNHISKPICSFFNPDNCSDEESKLIEELEKKSTVELETIVKNAEELVTKEELLFDEKVSKIQKQYDTIVEEFNLKLDEIKEQHNYKFVEQLLTLRLMMMEEEDDDLDDLLEAEDEEAEAEEVGSEL